MATRWRSVVLVAADPRELADFWQHATGLARVMDEPHEVVLAGGTAVGFVLVRGTPPEGQRVHVDLASTDLEGDLRDLCGRGARVVGRPGDGWVMLADPAGNAFCMIAEDPDPAVAK